MADATMDPLEQAHRALEESRARAAADAPLLAVADQVVGDLRLELAVNNWAARVQAAFQARRGAA